MNDQEQYLDPLASEAVALLRRYSEYTIDKVVNGYTLRPCKEHRAFGFSSKCNDCELRAWRFMARLHHEAWMSLIKHLEIERDEWRARALELESKNEKAPAHARLENTTVTVTPHAFDSTNAETPSDDNDDCMSEDNDEIDWNEEIWRYDGRAICMSNRPWIPSDGLPVSHMNAVCVGSSSSDTADYYRCEDCGATWTEELPE